METLLISVPEQKSDLIKQLLRELGVKIQSQTKARKMAQDINRNIRPGDTPSVDEIVAEVRAFQSEQ